VFDVDNGIVKSDLREVFDHAFVIAALAAIPAAALPDLGSIEFCFG
jgi:hypothetical protein